MSNPTDSNEQQGESHHLLVVRDHYHVDTLGHIAERHCSCSLNAPPHRYVCAVCVDTRSRAGAVPADERRCDYRNKECAAYGQTVGNRWICNNHICEQLQRCWLGGTAATTSSPAAQPELRRIPRVNALLVALRRIRDKSDSHGNAKEIALRAIEDYIESSAAAGLREGEGK